MNYSRNIAKYLVVSVFILFLDFLGVLRFVRNISDEVTQPIKREVYSANVSIRNTVNAVVKFPQFVVLVEDFEELKKQSLEQEQEIEILKAENDKLRSQLEAPLSKNYAYIPASVLASSRFMEISVGQTDGVKKNLSVVDGDVYVGKIDSVSDRRSLVLLPTDLQSKIPVKTSRGVRGFVVGQSGQNMLLDEVLQKDPLFLEDFVVTSGEDGYPPNLIIGKVVHIIVSDVEVYKKAKIEPLIDFQKLETVFVIKNT